MTSYVGNVTHTCFRKIPEREIVELRQEIIRTSAMVDGMLGVVSDRGEVSMTRGIPDRGALKTLIKRIDVVKERIEASLAQEEKVGCGIPAQRIAKVTACVGELGSCIGAILAGLTLHPYVSCAFGATAASVGQVEEWVRGISEKKQELTDDLKTLRESADMLRLHVLEIAALSEKAREGTPSDEVDGPRRESSPVGTLNRMIKSGQTAQVKTVKQAAQKFLSLNLSKSRRPSVGVEVEFGMKGRRISPPPDSRPLLSESFRVVKEQPRVTFPEVDISFPQPTGSFLKEVKAHASSLTLLSHHSTFSRQCSNEQQGPGFIHISSKSYTAKELISTPSLPELSNLACSIKPSGSVELLGEGEKFAREIWGSEEWEGDEPLSLPATPFKYVELPRRERASSCPYVKEISSSSSESHHHVPPDPPLDSD